MTTEPDNTHKGYINTLVTTLKDNSIWAKIDIAYLLAAHTNANDEALINIVNPGTFDGVEVPNGGSLTFTQYEGFASDGNAYINTSYNPSTDATNFALNSGAIGVYSRSDIFEARYEFGGHTNGASIDGSVIALTNDNFYGSINCADITGTSLDSTQGMYVASRLSSGDVDLYRNGSKVKDDTTSSGSLFNGDLYLCNRNVNGSPGTPSTKQLSFAFISSGLTLSEVSTLSEAVNEYMTSLGKNVYSGSGNPLLPPPSYITVNSTFENISIHLDLTSLGQTDSDLDSTFVIEYKEAVSLGPYLPSAPVARCHTGYTIDGSATTYNFWAGSCMHLNPDTEYEVKTTYYDPDEGSAVIDIFSASTQAYPTTPTTQKYCIPGTSGGDGSSGNPWQGLQTAVDNASAGDNIECANGTYDDISITSLSGTKANPIRFYAANVRQAIIDANASIYGIQINPSSGTIDYIEFDGFEIRDATSGGIGIHECNFISIKNCYIWDVPNGIRARGWDNDNINHTYIYNNKIIGNTTWPRTDGGWGPDKGVWTSGNNETICYNEISNFDDGISWESQNFDEVNYGADIHHNYVHKIVDDAVEIDESVSNVRVYKNYIYDARDGVSTGPLHGGPCYVFRNVIYNMETSGHKLTRGGTGVYMYNNTECMLGYGHVNSSSSKSTWNNTITKNMAGFSQFDFYAQFGSLPDSTDHDWNYNFFYSSTYSVRYIWNNTAYTTAASLYSAHGLAQNDGTITFSDVTTGSLPTDDYDAHSPGSYDWRPTSGSGLIGAGIKINNVNDPWDSANPPTAGAFVYNETLDSVGCNF
jgi:hypothetical protein